MNVGVLFGKFTNWDNGFTKKRTKKAYALFSKIAKEKNIELYFSTFKNYSEGILKEAWMYDNDWQLVNDVEIDTIFDRVESTLKNDKLKTRIAKKIRVVNNIGLNKLGWDKQYTYDYFSEHVPRCYPVDSYEDLMDSIEQIGGKQIVLKPRYGVGGCDVTFIDKEHIEKYKDKKLKGYVVQEFIDSSKGILELGIDGVHDLRVIIIDGEINHSYIRIAAPDCLMANCCKGGRKVFLSDEKIPEKILEIVHMVDTRLDKYKPRIYSVDFVYDSKQEPWIMEIETIPGISYYDSAESTQKEFMEKMIQSFLEAPEFIPIEDEEEEKIIVEKETEKEETPKEVIETIEETSKKIEEIGQETEETQKEKE